MFSSFHSDIGLNQLLIGMLHHFFLLKLLLPFVEDIDFVHWVDGIVVVIKELGSLLEI